MFCNHCGTQLPEGAGFCHNCGAKSVAPASAALGDTGLRSFLRRRWVLVVMGAGLAGAVAAAFLGIFLLTKDNEGSQSESRAELPAATQEAAVRSQVTAAASSLAEVAIASPDLVELVQAGTIETDAAIVGGTEIIVQLRLAEIADFIGQLEGETGLELGSFLVEDLVALQGGSRWCIAGSRWTVWFADTVSLDELGRALDTAGLEEHFIKQTRAATGSQFIVYSRQLAGTESAHAVGPAPETEKDRLEDLLAQRFGPMLDSGGTPRLFPGFSSLQRVDCVGVVEIGEVQQPN